MNYYNENDKKAAAWLRELIAAGVVANGEVDERSIIDVQPQDLAGYTQVHLFAGIGGWSYALRLAGWSDDLPVWTGSCPCQPFSTAGKQRGVKDERHLWPEMRRLVAECAPPVVFGEQVASKAGREWLSGVRSEMEALGYAVGAADLCAAGVGAPHIRQRLWWVADSASERLDGRKDSARAYRGSSSQDGRGLGNAEKLHEHVGRDYDRRDQQMLGSSAEPRSSDCAIVSDGGAWDDAAWVACADGKTRRVEAGTFPLADGIPGRVGLLRGYGNAIVPQVAAAFVLAFIHAGGH